MKRFSQSVERVNKRWTEDLQQQVLTSRWPLTLNWRVRTKKKAPMMTQTDHSSFHRPANISSAPKLFISTERSLASLVDEVGGGDENERSQAKQEHGHHHCATRGVVEKGTHPLFCAMVQLVANLS